MSSTLMPEMVTEESSANRGGALDHIELYTKFNRNTKSNKYSGLRVVGLVADDTAFSGASIQ